ncbi:hypothetical protein KAJ27_19180 [bacterium]|nr:hypothetical protein [bacterium]
MKNNTTTPFLISSSGRKTLIVFLILIAGILIIIPSYKSKKYDNKEFRCAKIMLKLETAFDKLESENRIKIIGKGEKANSYNLIKFGLLKEWDHCNQKGKEYPYSVFRSKTEAGVKIKCKFHGTVSNSRLLAENRIKQKDSMNAIQRYVGYFLIIGGILIFFFL